MHFIVEVHSQTLHFEFLSYGIVYKFIKLNKNSEISYFLRNTSKIGINLS